MLHNLGLTTPVEIPPYVALVPGNDPRLADARAAKGATARLLTGFNDDFRRPVRPSALVLRDDAPDSIRGPYPLASFRNLVALSAMVVGRAYALDGSHALHPLWSDYFDFYPTAPSRNDDELLGRSVAKLSLDRVDRFRGQTSPHLSPWSGELALDEPVFRACVREWRQRFLQRRLRWRSRVLFRSLEMAYLASRVPAVGSRHPTIHDVGTAVGLWVSAFEILKRDRNARADLPTVLRLLRNWEFETPELRHRRYLVKWTSGNPVSVDGSNRFNFAQKLYGEIYRTRCDFLHGNPVTAGKLFPGGGQDGPLLLSVASLVYRVALLSYLPPPPTPRGIEALASRAVERIFQDGRVEGALRAVQTSAAT